MQDSNLETNTLFKILKVIMYALLATPLLIWSVFLFPFITTKVLYLRILVEIALAVYIYLAFQYPQLRPRWNWLTGAVWIYMAVIIIASLFGVNISKSFMGTIERGEGIVTMLHFAVYFMMLPAVFRREKSWYQYLMTTVGMIGAVGVYGMLQRTDFPLVISGQGNRIAGTIGNASFFAGFMLLGLFMSVYLLYHPRTKTYLQKTYLWVLSAVTLIAMYLSQTRGAIVALAAVIVLFALVVLFRSRTARQRTAGAVILAVVLLAGFGVYFGRNSALVQSQTTLRRLSSISVSDITTQSRLDTWQASYQGWLDRPLLGYGYENYNIAFNKYFPPTIFKDQGSQLWFDRAHNIIFDIAVTSGILGLLAYLSIFIAGFYYLFRLYKKFRSRDDLSGFHWHMPLIFGLSLTAYFIQNLFVFDTQATYLVFFLLLAYLSHLHNRFLASGSQLAEQESRESYQPNFLAIAVLIVFAVVSVYFINIEPALANSQAIKGIISAQRGEYTQVQPRFEKALSLGTYMDEEIRQRLVDFTSDAVASGQLTEAEQSEIYQFTIDELEKSIEDAPVDVKNYLYLLTVINRAVQFDQSYLDRGLSLIDKTVELSPTRPQIYFEIGQIYFSSGDSEKALDQFRKAVELNPEPKESRINYAVAAIFARRTDLADQQLAVITEEKGGTITAADHINLARAYRSADMVESAVEHLRQALVKDPQREEDIYIVMIQIYAESCMVDEVRNTLDKVTQSSPNLAIQASQFLQQTIENCSKTE